MNDNPKIFPGLLFAGLLVLLVSSCGDDGKSTRPCPDCEFWEIAYGGVGRFPAASPDPNVVAFVTKYQLPEKIEYPFDPGDLSMGGNYHVWLGRTEDVSDTVWYYQITYDQQDDFHPAWGPDGNLLAFERNIGQENERQIFVVDVSDPEDPSVPLQVTDGNLKPPLAASSQYQNINPSWVSLGGRTWLSFVNYPSGAGDHDIGLLSWDDLVDTTWISIDPADFARDENGVMSFMFNDQQASSNASHFITFSSPDRRRVGNIRVVASTEEQPDSSVVTEILVNGKSSGQNTPYTFLYRPAGASVRISSRTAGYCAEAGDSVVLLPDTTTVFLIDFEHTRGTLGVSSTRSNLFIYLNGEQQEDENGIVLRTEGGIGKYTYVKCVMPDTLHRLHTETVFGVVCGDTARVSVAPGETTWVDFECPGLKVISRGDVGGVNLTGAHRRDGDVGGQAALLTQQQVRSIWIVDTGEDLGIEDDRMYQVDAASQNANYPVLSPDGDYVAYLRGQYTSWEIVIADVSGFLSGMGDPVYHVIGLPGSSGDFECWRKPEKISWVPVQDGARILVSLSPCNGGQPDDFGLWVADVSGFLR